MTVLLVGLGGLAGVLARYGLSVAVESIWTIVAVNLVGSFLLGLLAPHGLGLGEAARTGVGVGFLGGFTTFSTLTVQTVLEADGGRTGTAVAYLLATVLGGLAAAVLGYVLAR